MKTNTEPKFLRDCREADKLIGGYDVMHWPAKDRKTHIEEDDGTLHVSKNGLRVCFDIGQDRSLDEQNERMGIVLRHLGLFDHPDVEKALWSEEDIQRERDEEDDICPCCGNPRS